MYANADQDAARQQQQAESALTQGASVLVLDAVDASAATSIVAAARSRGVVVIGYDRFISNAPLDYFVSYDNHRVGQLQGEALVRALHLDEPTDGVAAGRRKGVLLVGGAATDPNFRFRADQPLPQRAQGYYRLKRRARLKSAKERQLLIHY